MSLENLKEYAHRCASDPELLAKAKEFGILDMEEHMCQSSILGLDWTMDDMVAFRKEVIDSDDEFRDLSEDELEQIAGGLVTSTAAAVAASVAVGASVGAALGAALGGGLTAAGDGGW